MTASGVAFSCKSLWKKCFVFIVFLANKLTQLRLHAFNLARVY